MLKKLLLGGAILWTLAIAVLCLSTFDDLPDVGIDTPDADKYVHGSLHFVFTILWYAYFRERFPRLSHIRLLVWAVVLSIAYGIVIEIAQYLFTDTRKADLLDACANTAGAIVAMLILSVTRKNPVEKQLE